MSFSITDSAIGVPPRSSRSLAPNYGMILATYFVSTSVNTQNLIPYLSGLFGMNVVKGQQDFTGIGCSSIVRVNLQLYFVWLIDENVSNTSRIGANLSALDPVLCLFGLSSNLKYLRTFRYRSLGIVFEKNRNFVFFVVEKPYGMIFSIQTSTVLKGNKCFQFT